MGAELDVRDLEPLARSCFRASAAAVAPALLGHWLVRAEPDGMSGGVIVETEAYLRDDPACHAYSGETARNRAMFGPPGHAYVYLIYGVHHCFNAVCGPEGVGEAVLVRAIEPEFGVDAMRARRPVRHLEQLASGPGKLCAALDIDLELDGVDLCRGSTGLRIARNPRRDAWVAEQGVHAGPRIGIRKAADAPLRFCVAGSAFLSRSLNRG